MNYCLILNDDQLSSGSLTILAESFRPDYPLIRLFLTSIADPISRPSLIHEYLLTSFSIGAAATNGVSADEILTFFLTYTYGLSSNPTASDRLGQFIYDAMNRYHQARIVIEGDRSLMQCKNISVLEHLLSDSIIRSASAHPVEVKHTTTRWRGEEYSVPYFILQRRSLAKAVSQRSAELGFPIHQEYDYENDTSLRSIGASLRAQTKPRPYQVDAVEACSSYGSLHSGCVVLPCGAGKTLVGIMLLCKVKKPTMIVCAGSVSVEQWKNQIHEYASLQPVSEEIIDSSKRKYPRTGTARIACITGKQKDEVDEDTDVIITTYSMLVSAHRTKMRRETHTSNSVDTSGVISSGASPSSGGEKKRKRDPRDAIFSPQGLLILDEVHIIPADSFREGLSHLDSKAVVGLTATCVREDRKILDLFYLVGPKLFDVSMESLCNQGYLARVHCAVVHTPMTKEFGLEYLDRRISGSSSTKTARAASLIALASANPNKMLCTLELVRQHLLENAKILVFCDQLLLLKEYGRLLNAPVICGETQHKERLMVFSDFQSTANVNVVCVSRVGDVSVNLPSANVVIQVSSHGGSRRQEVQRLGRILRPKEKCSADNRVDAYFYSIVSLDTVEMAFAAHRTSFLVDQGFSCRLVEFHATDTFDSCNGDSSFPEVPKVKKMDSTCIKMEGVQKKVVSHNTVAITDRYLSGRSYVCSISFQLNFLSRVISNWELEYQQLTSAKPKTEPIFSSNTQSIKSSENNLRELSEIKKEWEGGTASESNVAQVQLIDIVGVDDEFVYHEF